LDAAKIARLAKEERMESTTNYLRLADLRRLKRLFFTSRRRVAGRFTGRHASRQRGRSVEFSDYRPYLPGDPLGDVDWKAFARSDRLFVRLSEQQSDAAVHLLADASASMAYGGIDGEGPSKFAHAAQLAAAVAFLVTHQGDRAAFAFSQGRIKSYLPAARRRGQRDAVLSALEREKPRGKATLAGTLREFAHRIEPRGLLVAISDLIEEPAPIFAALGAYAARGGHAVVFHVLHGDELKLPTMVGGTQFIDSETADRLATDVEEIRADYDARLHDWLELWRAGCAARGIDYNLVPTTTPYYQALERYLASRR
jgi:uncharacterized protein (DUF58 family)